jgi:hypothetical protein
MNKDDFQKRLQAILNELKGIFEKNAPYELSAGRSRVLSGDEQIAYLRRIERRNALFAELNKMPSELNHLT